MELRKFIATTIREYLNEQQEVDSNLVKNYTFDNSRLEPLIKNARKWRENDFIEEYVNFNDITIYWGDSYFSSSINKGDEVILARTVRDNNGNTINRKYSFYKKVIADKDYGTNHWDFIMDNTKELQNEAKRMYHQNKHNPKPKLNKNDKTIKGYHASPNKFKQFKYGEHSESGQLGADFGFFFFKDLKNAKYYGEAIKQHNKKAFLYECTIRLGKYDIWKGEDVGTNWGRVGDLQQAEIEGYDVVIIEDADTGYGITDEIVVFDDDNIKIDKIIQI
jgi:DNA mismatch repair ATPase MutL